MSYVRPLCDTVGIDRQDGRFVRRTVRRLDRASGEKCLRPGSGEIFLTLSSRSVALHAMIASETASESKGFRLYSFFCTSRISSFRGTEASGFFFFPAGFLYN